MTRSLATTTHDLRRLGLFALFLLLACPVFAGGNGRVASLGGVIRGSGVHGQYIYLAQRDAIIILDAADPQRIHEVSRYSLKDSLMDKMLLAWPVVFYVEHKPGVYYHALESIDVTSPTKPCEIKLIEVDHAKSVDLATSGSRLLVWSRGIHQYDITNPLKPVELPDLDLADVNYEKIFKPSDGPTSKIPKSVVYPGIIRNLKAVSDKLYVLGDNGDMDAFDISDPLKPKYINGAEIPKAIRAALTAAKADRPDSIPIGQNYQICRIDPDPNPEEDSMRHDLVIQDISNPADPRIVETLVEGEAGWADGSSIGGKVFDFWLSGNILYVSLQTEHTTAMTLRALSVHDLSDPLHPRCLGQYDGLDEYPEHATIVGDYLYVAEGENGMSIFRLDREAAQAAQQ